MDILRALAFVAKRQAQSAMPAAAWSHILSLELGWMSPGEAREFVARAVDAGILHESEGTLSLAVDAKSVEIPQGFRPDPLATSTPLKVDPFLQLVERLARHESSGRDAVLAKVAAQQEIMGGLLSADVAIQWLCREAGLPWHK